METVKRAKLKGKKKEKTKINKLEIEGDTEEEIDNESGSEAGNCIIVDVE